MASVASRLAASSKVAGPLLAGRVHAVADRRTEAGRIRPVVEDAVGERREERLDLVVEPALPAAVQALRAP